MKYKLAHPDGTKIVLSTLDAESCKVNMDVDTFKNMLLNLGFVRCKNSSAKYGRAWKRIRDKFVDANPTCAICGKPTEEVHHIVSVFEGGANHSKENLMAVCHECHAAIHANKIGIAEIIQRKSGEK